MPAVHEPRKRPAFVTSDMESSGAESKIEVVRKALDNDPVDDVDEELCRPVQ